MVKWHNGRPSTAFQRIPRDQFTLTPQRPPQVPMTMRTVDAKPACRLFANCHYAATTPSMICEYHLARIEAVVNSDVPLTTRLLQRIPCTWLDISELNSTDRDFVSDEMKLLRRYKATRQVWVIDVEGIMNPAHNYASVPSQIGVVNVFDRTKSKKFNINWGGTIAEVIEAVYHPSHRQNVGGKSLFTRFLGKAYKDFASSGAYAATHGHTIPEIRRAFRDLGVNEKSLFVSWSLHSADYDAVARVFTEQVAPMIPRNSFCTNNQYSFDRFNLVGVIRRATDMACLQLKAAHACVLLGSPPVHLWYVGSSSDIRPSDFIYRHDALVDAHTEADITLETFKRLSAS